MQVGGRQVVGPGMVAAVDPAGAQAGRGGAGDVDARMVADVQHLVRGQAQACAGGVEDAGVRLGHAVLAGAEVEREVRVDADRGEVRVAVGQSGQRAQPRQPREALERIVVEIHAVAFAEEAGVRGVGQRDVAAAVAQRALDGQPPQQAQIVRMLGMVGVHLQAQRAHLLDREARGGQRAVRLEPGVQGGLDAFADRRERPQGVVEVEGDGADGVLHPRIVGPAPRRLTPAGAPSRPCPRRAPARSSRRRAAAPRAAGRRCPTGCRTPSAR